MTHPYKEWVAAYYAKGWKGILPLPYGAKHAPPHGHTGREGKDPSAEMITAWFNNPTEQNIALRLPPDVVVIDIDNYTKGSNTKHGQETLEEHLKKWGPLPATWAATSRGTERGPGLSRHLYYRLPEPKEVIAVLPGGDVEILQHHHRYAVAPGSVLKDADGSERVSRWYTPHGLPAAPHVVPSVHELAELPPAWVEGLTTAIREHTFKAPARDGVMFLHALERDIRPPCLHTESLVEQMPQGAEGSRYDNFRDWALRVVNAGAAGHAGVGSALAQGKQTYLESVSGEVGRDAEGEWHRHLLGAAQILVAERGSIEPDQSCVCFRVANITEDIDRNTPGVSSSTLPRLGMAGRALDHAHLTRLVKKYVARSIDIMWCPSVGWLMYTGKRWETGDTVHNLLAKTLRDWAESIHKAWETKHEETCAKGTPCEKVDGVLDVNGKPTLVCGDTKAQVAMWKLAQQNTNIAAVMTQLKDYYVVASEHLNKKAHLLTCDNGEVDLRSGVLVSHNPHNLSTKLAEGRYLAEGVEHPRWTQILESIPEDIRNWMQTRIGQSATGFAPPDDVCFLVDGPRGSNGKSAFFQAIKLGLGDYVKRVSADILLGGKDNRREAGVRAAELVDTRLAVIEELPEDGYLDAHHLKEYVGTPSYTYRPLYQPGKVNDTPSHTLWITTNHLPEMGSLDEAAWRRVVPVPMPYKYLVENEPLLDPETERRGDSTLKEFMNGEARTDQQFKDAVLTWIVQGAVKFHEDGANKASNYPEKVRQAKLDWVHKANPLIPFFMEYLELDPGGYISSSQLYDLYSEEWAAAGRHRVKQDRFNQRVIDIVRKEFATTVSVGLTSAARGRMQWIRSEDSTFSKIGITAINPENKTWLVTQIPLTSGRYWLGLKWRERS